MERAIDIAMLMASVALLVMVIALAGREVGLWAPKTKLVTVVCTKKPDGASVCRADPIRVRP